MAAHEEQDDKLHLHMALDRLDAILENDRTLKDDGIGITIALPGFQRKRTANLSTPFYTHSISDW